MNLTKFLSRIKLGNPTECWEWTGSLTNSGYGSVSYEGKCYTAHRLMAWMVGLVPSPYAPTNRKGTGFVLHECDNRKCCNPNHFTLGTFSKNQADAYKRGRRAQPKGMHHSNAKVTYAQADEIRKRHLLGEHQSVIAKDYGISQAAVSKIVRKITYT